MGAEMGMQNPSALFQQERMWEKQIAHRILSNMRAVQSTRVGVDSQLDGLYNQIPPPPELTQTKTFLRYRMAIAKSEELQRVIALILKFIVKPLLDLFKKDPILVPSYWKEAATAPTEREYIFAPEGMVPESEDPEEKVLERFGKIDLEDSSKFMRSLRDLHGDTGEESFVGPSGYSEKDESGEEEEEDLGL